ncbi:MAG: GNAT family N-acetyltransferase [Methanomassiliicoccales archaeon]|nr:GNAT family N-acetyltransferase [Methanomassiliicoccales archaeon]
MDETLEKEYRSKLLTADEAVLKIGPGRTVFLGTACGEPQALVRSLLNKSYAIIDSEVMQTLSLGLTFYAEDKFMDQFRLNAFFIGPNVRAAVNDGRADYTPVNLSDIERLFSSGLKPVDVALIQVAPPDQDGYCNLGVSVDITKAAAMHADLVIAEVNPNMPRLGGDSRLHMREIDYLVESDQPLIEYVGENEPSRMAPRIGKNVAELIPDGATIQVGYGAIPDSILSYLTDKKDLGVHTEMFSDGIIDLVEKGVINGKKKRFHNGKVVSSFCMGSKRLYDFINNNEMFEMYPSSYTNDPCNIARNNDMIAINSALEVDLTGQVCTDQIGHRFYSGIGGQADFMRGASRSRGGKAVIALPSTAQHYTVSRIVPTLTAGGGVTTTRGDVQFIVTEFGVADLRGKSIMERALALIGISHPRFRAELLMHAKSMHYVYQDQLEAGYVGVYPDHYETIKVVADQEIYIRPAKPTDEPMLKDLFYSFSRDTVYQRFMGLKRAMPHRELQRIVNIDYDTRMTIPAIVNEDGVWTMVAFAMYDLDKRSNTAEISFAVRDSWQNKRLGTMLMDIMVTIAKERKIKAFTAELLAENMRMLDLFYRTGLKVETRLVADTYLVTIDLWSK